MQRNTHLYIVVFIIILCCIAFSSCAQHNVNSYEVDHDGYEKVIDSCEYEVPSEFKYQESYKMDPAPADDDLHIGSVDTKARKSNTVEYGTGEKNLEITIYEYDKDGAAEGDYKKAKELIKADIDNIEKMTIENTNSGKTVSIHVTPDTIEKTGMLAGEHLKSYILADEMLLVINYYPSDETNELLNDQEIQMFSEFVEDIKVKH